jgi:hypothetical protein
MPFSAQGLLNNSKITLESAATEKFGSVVEDFTKGTLGRLSGSGLGNQPVNRNDGSWYASSYAAALANSNMRPKLKFLFKVQFIFTAQAIKQFSILGAAGANDFTFMIKQVDRPKFDFEYEDDVNMYNFHTKVLKRIKHRELTMVFMDDVGNRVFDFFRTLMMIHQPITQRQVKRDGTTLPPPTSNLTLASGNGMVFSDGNSAKASSDTAHRSVVNSAFGNSIECIRVKQIYADPHSQGLSGAVMMNTFDFINPRISSFDLDELSHEQNDVSALTMAFDYDWMEMVKVGSLGINGIAYTPDYQNVAMPGIHGAPVDITPNNVGNGTGTGPSGGGGGGNKLINGLSGMLGRGVSGLTSDAIGSLVKKAGGGAFATAIGSQVSGAVGGPIGGIISGGARDLFGGATNRVTGMLSSSGSQSARASAPVITDSNVLGSVSPTAIVSSSSAYTPEQQAALAGITIT